MLVKSVVYGYQINNRTMQWYRGYVRESDYKIDGVEVALVVRSDYVCGYDSYVRGYSHFVESTKNIWLLT